MFYKRFVSPRLDRLDSETWHKRAVDFLHIAETSAVSRGLLQLLFTRRTRFIDPRLHTKIGSVHLDNPLLVGAGWDKQGRAVRGLHALGFGGVEVGSVLRDPQDGNPKPRQFMIGDGVCLNHLGFNSKGMEEVALNLERYSDDGIPIGISLGKNKEVSPLDAPEAHAAVASRLARFASYFVVNVSSPNTPDLRTLQEKGPLRDIVQAVRVALTAKGYNTDLFVKIAPDLTHHAVDDVIDVAMQEGLAGIIASNTTINPNIKAKYGERWRGEAGGLSGNDEEFRRMSTEQIAHIYRETNGRLSIIGVGGVKDAETALEKMRAGASAVQMVTALRGEGLGVADKTNRGIARRMRREGIPSLGEIVGVDAKR